MATKRKKTRGPRFLLRKFPQIKEIIDSGQAVQVKVQSRDCTEGKKGQPSECALARATRRDYQADGVVIGMSFSYIIRGSKAIRFMTPATVSREITSFDRHSDFAPGDYHLAPVSPSQRLGMKRNKKPHSGSRDEKRRVHHGTVRVRSVR